MKRVNKDINDSPLGGDSKECFLTLVEAKQYDCIPDILDIMEEITRLIECTNRLDISEVLDPLSSTDLDVGIHAHFIQRHSISYIEKNLRYKRFMESHDVPVNFYPPDYKNFTRHMRFREINNAGVYALKHEKQAMLMFATAFGMEKQFKKYKLPKIPKKASNYEIPFPYVVRQFAKFQYFPNAKCYNNKLFQHIHFHNFMVGPRAPSELAILKTDNVKVDFEGNGTLCLVQPKRHGEKRIITMNKSVLSSYNYKSFKNYIDRIRPKVENQYSKDYLYLQESGKPFKVAHLGKCMSQTGKMVWEGFHPYVGRHWCSIANLIETKIQNNNYDYFFVNRWMGHQSIQTTMDYVAPAIEYYNAYQNSWIGHALKHSNGGKRDFPNRTKNRGLLGKTLSLKLDGLEEI